MKSKQINFFAIKRDIDLLVEHYEKQTAKRYFKIGLFDENIIPTYPSLHYIPDLGFTSTGDWNRIDAYLVMDLNIDLNVRAIPQRKGGVKFAVDQLHNPKSIELKFGGIYKNKENVIVGGRVGTASVDQDSIDLFNSYSSPIKKHFKRIGGFYVGQMAEQALNDGWRLVTNEKSPHEYDLKFED